MEYQWKSSGMSMGIQWIINGIPVYYQWNSSGFPDISDIFLHWNTDEDPVEFHWNASSFVYIWLMNGIQLQFQTFHQWNSCECMYKEFQSQWISREYFYKILVSVRVSHK